MLDTEKAQKTEVSVEDLLRVKRAERPDDAFWNKFDQELHQRMLQTLVKKDPWYIQVLRGVSGRIAQTGMVGAAAVFLGLMVIRPAFEVAPLPNPQSGNQQVALTNATANPVEVSMSELDSTEVVAAADYQMETISVLASTDAGYTREYSLDGIELSTYDTEVYTMDTATFATSGLAAGLVY